LAGEQDEKKGQFSHDQFLDFWLGKVDRL
jgi:hypothetical protein